MDALSPKQAKALEAVCETFAPGSAARGAPAAIVAAAPARDLAQLKQLLTLFSLRFPGLPRERREKALRGWADSRIPLRRTAFQALRKASLHFDAVLPASPAYEASGYPGPLGPGSGARAITPTPVTRDTELVCDVCVVGSGAGGGTAAAVLAAAGLDVVVLEAGEYYDDADFDGGEASGWARLYEQGGATATHDQSVGLLAGRCLGGSTVVNYTTSFRTPDEVRAEWGLHFPGDAFTKSLDAVCERLGVNTDNNEVSHREQVFRRGLERLGWHHDLMPRNVKDCDPRECGWCGFGCRRGAKQSTAKTWLVDAQAAGARILVGTEARRVLVSGGAAVGVEANRVTIRSRAVVVACGAIHTPALLRRSGLTNGAIGKHLRLHPATGVFGFFDEEIKPWEGVLQSVYSDQHRDLHGGYGVKYETTAMHPSLFAAFAPWRSAAQYRELAGGLRQASLVGVLLRDHGVGEVRVTRSGEPLARYRLTPEDVAHVRTGIDGGAQILEAAGATKVVSAHSRYVAYEPGKASRESFMAAADACGYGTGRCVYYSFHLMGSARMGDSPSTSACGPEGETWDVRNLVVADGSTFPSASGVNPMISIEAIAHLNASALADRLR